MAQGDANARVQLLQPEGLGQIVVRARFQCVHFVGFFAHDREHDDRDF